MMPASWKTAGAADVVVPHKLLAGLRVLVVDDDPTCLMILEKMLKNCNYQATVCNRAEIGLSMLRENTNGYDIVLSDVHMPDMDGFKLLEQIGLEMDLPVIMMSADDSKSVVMKGVTHGACDYLIKPVRIEALRNIWQHVVRRRKHDWKNVEPPSTSADDADQRQRVPEDVEVLKPANEAHTWKDAKRRKVDEDEAEAETEEREESSSKKPRVVWSVELHQQFVAAVNQLGIDKAVPKKILELMNVQGLTRENIASHLQKYRLYLKRVSGSQHLGSMDALFMDSPDVGYGSTSSLNGLELRALAAGGQSLATIQAVLLGRSNNSKYPISVPVIDQKNVYMKSRYGGEAGSQQLLHGIPTNIEPKQFVGLHQSHHHSFNIVNGQNQFQNHSNSNQYISWQPVSPNGMLTHGLGGYKTLNNLNQMRPYDSGFQDIGATSGKKTISLSADEENRRQWANAKGKSVEQYDQDDLLTAILKQVHVFQS